MFSRHPAFRPPVEDRPIEAPPRMIDPSVPMRACCCPAQPMVKVIMPPAHGRPHQVELWLCGHHYHVSQARLAAAGATVEEDLTQPSEPVRAGRATAMAS